MIEQTCSETAMMSQVRYEHFGMATRKRFPGNTGLLYCPNLLIEAPAAPTLHAGGHVDPLGP